jgi:hypothetical protein
MRGRKRIKRKGDDVDTLIMRKNIKVEAKVVGECI